MYRFIGSMAMCRSERMPCVQSTVHMTGRRHAVLIAVWAESKTITYLIPPPVFYSVDTQPWSGVAR